MNTHQPEDIEEAPGAERVTPAARLNRPPFSHYQLDQIKESGLLSPERMSEVEKLVESRIHPIFLHTGKEVPTARFVDRGNGTGWLHPNVVDEHSWAYARREALAYVLTPVELEVVNKHCLSVISEKREAQKFEKSTKLTDWDGGVFHGDQYHESIDDALETIEANGDQIPKYFWTAKPTAVFTGVDVSDVLQDAIESNGWEDMDVDDFHGTKELQEALDKFRDANAGVIAYFPDYKKAVVDFQNQNL